MDKIITNIILFVSCKILFRVRYENEEILKKYDKCMICSNHKMGINNIIKTINENEKIRLLMFPEGGVFKENYIEHKRKHKNGAVFIAATTGVPIIPIHITSRPRFFSKVTVSFGEPFFTNPEVLKDRKILREESQRLIDYIYEFTEK